jgi:outer membrane protein assembly factor BamB
MRHRAVWQRAALLTAFVSGGFCVFALGVLLLAVVQNQRETPLDSLAILRLKTQLASRPNDEAIKEEIRQLDLKLRQGYFERQVIMRRAAWLLVAGGLVFVLAMKAHASLEPPTLSPSIPKPPPPRDRTLARWSLIGSAVALAGGFAAISVVRPVYLPPRPPDSVQQAEAMPDWEALFQHWPGFRGAAGDGIVRQHQPLVMAWNGESGDNILWKVPLPLPGQSSPIVWKNRVYLTGASEAHRAVYCFDALSGESIWTLPLPREKTHAVEVFEETGLAAPTMTCDGRRLYAIFASGDLYAISPAGEILWERSLGVPDSQYGYSSSLASHRGRVIVQMDQGDPTSGKSALIAFDGETGRPAWRTPRAVGAAWSSPIVAPSPAGDRLVVCSMPLVSAYDPASGREIWHTEIMEGDVAPSPVLSEGITYVASDRAKAAAIPEGAGKIKPLWTHEDNLPDIVSPLCDGESLLLVTGAGQMTCLSVADGKVRWEHDLGTEVHASPLLVGDIVYLTDHHGLTRFFRLSEAEYKELGQAPLGEKVSASPAAAAGRLYFRTEKHLVCVGSE